MKKFLLILMLAFLALPLSAFEYDGIEYNITSEDDRTCEVGINSKFYGSIVIPETVEYDSKTYTVTSIGKNAFSGSYLMSIGIPNSITSIGNRAFYDTVLSNIEIPNSVTEIGNSAFEDCGNLKSVTIGNSVTEIGDFVFYYCWRLTSVTIGNSVTSIGTQAFYNCSLTSITIPSSVKEVNSSAFDGNNLTYIQLENETPPSFYSAFASYASQATLEIPQNSIFEYLISTWRHFLNIRSNGEEIEGFVQNDGVFEYHFLENEGKAILTGCINEDMSVASIPDRVVGDYGDNEKFFRVCAIGSDVFSENSNLSQLKLPANLEIIGNGAFKGCSGLKSVTIPNSVTEIEDNAFEDCNGLTKVEISDLEAWGNISFGNSAANPLKYAKRLYQNGIEIKEVVIPNSVTEIGAYAFYNCSGLTSVEIPNSVTKIGSFAFEDCSGLTKVKISDLEAWCNIDFRNYVANPLNYARHLYLNGEELTDLIIPNSVPEIGAYAFYNCLGLKNVVIGNSVTSIGEYAFYNCFGLTSVEIPNSVTQIENSALEGCTSLASISIPNSVTSIGNSAFESCYGLTSIEIPNSVVSIGEQAFRYIPINSLRFSDGPALLKFNGENNIGTKSIYLGRSFSGDLSLYPGLESLEVGGFVTTIPRNSFSNTTLTSVSINPGAQVVIEDGAFSGCGNLALLTLPEDIAEIGANAFNGCALRNVTVPGGVIGESAFAKNRFFYIILGAKVESIGEKAFDGSNTTLHSVYATPTTPPAAHNNTFSSYEAELYVPEEAIDIYYNFTRCWYRFSGKPLVCAENIVVTGPSSISGKTGDTFQLSATISPWDALDRVLWRSTNPAVATVDNNGLVTILNLQSSDEARARAQETGFCQIIASTLYEESPVAVVNIEVSEGGTSSIEYINPEDVNAGSNGICNQNDIYTLQGVCVKRQATQSDIDALTPGIYIIDGKKVLVK